MEIEGRKMPTNYVAGFREEMPAGRAPQSNKGSPQRREGHGEIQDLKK
jgi:hypothetical protein